MRTPIEVYEVIRVLDEYGIPRQKAHLIPDAPVKMVHGAPGTDEVKAAAKIALKAAGYTMHNLSHAPEGKLVAYVTKGDTLPLPPPRPPRSSVPRKVR